MGHLHRDSRRTRPSIQSPLSWTFAFHEGEYDVAVEKLPQTLLRRKMSISTNRARFRHVAPSVAQ